MKGNKTMKTETKTNTHMNHVAIHDGYNVCPECGRQAYAVMTEDQMYRVGCLHCGLRNGVGVFVEDELTDEMTESMRRLWNQKCIETEEYSVEALEVMEAKIGSYAMVDSHSQEILCFVRNVDAVKRFVLENPDVALGIYLLVNGNLQYMGCGYLVSELAQI